MLEAFIQEYKEYYELSFSDGFKGEFEKFCAFLSDPIFAPSKELKERLNALDSLFYEPLLVAVVGQFSSGKSSFLNAILGKNILPTGVIPVTAKPTFIKYAPQSFLKALYKDGREEFFDISALPDFVDQRRSLKEVKALYIYEPNEILKNISFIDTPGLNSLSSADTKETMQILSSCSGLIWLSLIDNAARHGELQELSLIPKELKEHSICLLNQKDKLTDEEIKRVLTHSKTTYNDYFSQILPISAKMQLENQPNSGFDELKSFLQDFDTISFVKANMFLINNKMKAQQDRILGILTELENIICDFENLVSKKFDLFEQNYKKAFELVFDELKHNANLIASLILEYIKTKECFYFQPKKTAFGMKFEKTTYQAALLDDGKALSELLYNDDKLSKLFNSLKRKFLAINEQIKADLNEIFANLKEQALNYRARYESLRKNDALYSDILHANIRQFSTDSWALFFGAYERELETKFARLDLFFERINIKISTNYANALRLTLFYIQDKITKQKESFEKDPLGFSLYFPTQEDINERVLTELSYYEFENEFIGSSPFSTKFLRGIKESFTNIKEQNLARIKAIKIKHQNALNDLEKLL